MTAGASAPDRPDIFNPQRLINTICNRDEKGALAQLARHLRNQQRSKAVNRMG